MNRLTMPRRRVLGWIGAGLAAGVLPRPTGPARATTYPVVRPGRAFSFPSDHGAHPAFRTEWWYVTGVLRLPGGDEAGFQVTFFRNRPPGGDDGNPSRFAPEQILFAHAGLSDPKVGRIQTAERAAREGFGLAQAKTDDVDVVIDDWFFRRDGDGRFVTRVGGDAFSFELALEPTTTPLLQGEGGYSRKGPDPEDASYYYSLPQLRVTGTLRARERGDTPMEVTGLAWLDREWSSDYLAGGSVGWDWTGLNFDDGAALTAFRLRNPEGGTVYAGGSWRAPGGTVTNLAPGNVRFTPRRRWRSERSGGDYPIDPVVEVDLPGGGSRELPLSPVFADQEVWSVLGLPVYWEGLVRGPGCVGYLELVGYGSAARF